MLKRRMSMERKHMRTTARHTKFTTAILAMALLATWSVGTARAQDQAPPPPPASDQGPPPSYSPEQLDKLVSRIALYPDSLLAQTLAAAGFPDQIPDAAKWADEIGRAHV